MESFGPKIKHPHTKFHFIISVPVLGHFTSGPHWYFLILCSVPTDSRGPCSRRSCRHNSLCVESADLAFCECNSDCGLDFSPVCGSDGATYKNKCLMEEAACLKEEPIVVVEQGPCSKYIHSTAAAEIVLYKLSHLLLMNNLTGALLNFLPDGKVDVKLSPRKTRTFMFAVVKNFFFAYYYYNEANWQKFCQKINRAKFRSTIRTTNIDEMAEKVGHGKDRMRRKLKFFKETCNLQNFFLEQGVKKWTLRLPINCSKLSPPLKKL